MKKKILILCSISIISLSGLFLVSCKDDEPNPLTVLRVVTDLDLPLDGGDVTNVPINSKVIVIFNKAVNDSWEDPNAVALLSDGLNIFPSSSEVKGDSVILNPFSPFELGTTYTISVLSSLKAMDGASAQETAIGFGTFGRANVKPPQSDNQVSYFPFTGNMKDESGSHTPPAVDIKDVTFDSDRFGFEGLAGSFNGTTTIVEIPQGELYMTNNFTLSIWIKANSTKNGQFILGLAGWKGFYLDITSDWSWIKFTSQFKFANNTSDPEDNLFAGTGETKDNGGWQGTIFQKDVLPHDGGVGTTYFKDKWAHVVFTYEATTKLSTMYLNGEKVNQLDFNLWPTDDVKTTTTGLKFAGNLTGGGNKLALGFIQGSLNRAIVDSWADPSDIYSNHFQGLMDDLRIFKVALTEAEVTTLYTAEKP